MPTTTLYAWAEHELRSADLGDRRLNKRLARLVADLAARPQASIPEASGNWAGTKGAYRFLANNRIAAEDIRAAHRAATLERLPADGLVLALQDTTLLDFTAHPTTAGLGHLIHVKHFGLLVHATLLADAYGVPLGLLHQRVWARDRRQRGQRQHRRRKETAAKESQRWLDGLAATEAALPPERLVLTIADREADFYDLFAAPRRPGHDLLIRAKERRRVHHAAGLLGPAVRASAAAGQVTLPLPRSDDRPRRQATLTIRFGRFWIKPPSTHPRRAALGPVPLWAVRAEEENPPAGPNPVRWLLLTTVPIASFEAAVQAVLRYSRRWLVERLHFTLKSGCQIEALQLETAARLHRAVATYAIVAWRLLWLTYEARQQPQASCEAVFARQEWEVLHRQVNPGIPLPAEPPSLRAVVHQVARLGGFLGRRHDGEPGVKTLWRGLRRLHDVLDGYRLAREHQATPHPSYG